MSTNPNQGQNPDQSDTYGGGYGGYRPPSPADDPYGAATHGQQPGTGSQGAQGDPNYVYGQQQQSYGSGQQQQQQYTYQPPLSATRSRGGSGPNEPTSLGMNPRREALFSYLAGPFTGIAFLLLEKRNRFVRFSAAQSTVVFGAALVLYIILRFLVILPLIGFLLGPVIGCLTSIVLIASIGLWLFLMLQSYRGVQVRLPVVGEYADALLARFGRGNV